MLQLCYKRSGPLAFLQEVRYDMVVKGLGYVLSQKI